MSKAWKCSFSIDGTFKPNWGYKVARNRIFKNKELSVWMDRLGCIAKAAMKAVGCKRPIKFPVKLEIELHDDRIDVTVRKIRRAYLYPTDVDHIIWFTSNALSKIVYEDDSQVQEVTLKNKLQGDGGNGCN
ncbi:MAG: hypothetical protein DRG33_01530 [Deltaproteobacteria bacterium]|nr:MAG: hypothetical protein DRG33_01530 [Deltaproteobacteria bacterium]